MKRENNIILPRRRILPWNWESNRTRTELEPTLWQNRTELELTCRKICRTQTFLFSCSTCDRRTFNVWLVAWHSWFLPTVQRNQPNVKRPSVARRTWTCCVCVSVVKCRRSLTGEHPCTLVGGLSPNFGVGGGKKTKNWGLFHSLEQTPNLFYFFSCLTCDRRTFNVEDRLSPKFSSIGARSGQKLRFFRSLVFHSKVSLQPSRFLT